MRVSFGTIASARGAYFSGMAATACSKHNGSLHARTEAYFGRVCAVSHVAYRGAHVSSVQPKIIPAAGSLLLLCLLYTSPSPRDAHES
eukprot:3741066-Prymnesium_polylepis.1